MFVTNDGEGKRCAKESEQLNATTDTAKLSRGVEMQALIGITGRKAHAGGLLSQM